ncbi:MAG: outer membrane lipoprotein-sorting protein [Proteobacteria bacterium]|nr:MAG: outer membrane lipoprotein-sorting protein [Pseudomonadota bacterium]
MKHLVYTSLFLSAVIGSQAKALTEDETKKVVATVDEKQRNSGDYASTVVIEEWEKKKDAAAVKAKDPYELKKAFEARVYRRDEDDQLIILFSKPKAEAGKGYLRKEKTLLLYEPSLGKWERQTERASIGGTGSKREDFDESRLSEEYTAKWIADEKLGKFEVHRIKLNVKPGIEVASPTLELWVDKATQNVLKREESALSGKLLRRALYPGWEKRFSKSKGADVYVPKEIYAYDLLDNEKLTKVKLQDVNLDPLEKNMFTKAWIEGQSR